MPVLNKLDRLQHGQIFLQAVGTAWRLRRFNKKKNKMAFTISGIGNYSGITFTTTQPPPPPIYYLWSWGQGISGRLGLGNTTDYSSPKQIGALTTWSSIAAAEGWAMALKTDGTMWSWGRNYAGQLGLGNTTYYSSPKQIGALTTWANISTGKASNMFAIKTNGTLWAWGGNYGYKLGLGNTTSYSSPVQVGSLTDWAIIISLAGNGAAAIKTNGTMWSWGQGSNGQLGLGNTTNTSSPQQIGALTTWSNITNIRFGALATKTDGTLWTWGANGYGELGLGDTTNRSSPVQIGALTTWQSVSAGYYHGLAVKTDGTLWSWGRNAVGSLGLGDTTNRSSPVQVGALTTWLNISGGVEHNLAIKTDGTMWSWGDNQSGRLGIGDITNRSSPVQIGSLTNWANVSAGGSFSLAIG
jgi:alpha-tubulin suppressor-like RCC1 family protein